MPTTLADLLSEHTRAALLAGLQDVRAGVQELVTLVMHNEDTGEDIAAPLVPGTWHGLAGRPGVRFFPIPHPDGVPGLHAALCKIAPGSGGHQSSTDHSQRVTMLGGAVTYDGQQYVDGQTFYIPAGHACDWSVGDKGYSSIILFNVPDLPDEVLAAQHTHLPHEPV